MKKLVAVIASLALTSCASGSGTNVAPDVTGFENAVIADVEASCKVVPVLSSLAPLWPIYGNAVANAANAICAAVAKAPVVAAGPLVLSPSGTGNLVHLGQAPVTVRGHTITFQ